MSSKYYALTVNAYVFLSNLMDYAKKLERGDADSSGSTLRTLGIVMLIIVVVGIIGLAVVAAGNRVAGVIGGAAFPW